MTPQLTLQTPLQIPSEEIPKYLDKLWSTNELNNNSANTFSLIIWQPAWIEQELIRIGKIQGPITGNQSSEVIEKARNILLENDLPHSTPPLGKSVKDSLSKIPGNNKRDDLRGQYVDSSISVLNPRRLITLAPTLENNRKLDTLVAAYCPLLEEEPGSSACGDVVVIRGGLTPISNGLGILNTLIPEDLPSWLWWNGSLDEAIELLNNLSLNKRRIIIDSALGNPKRCLDYLKEGVSCNQSINDLNWLRLRAWRETLAMVFDPPERRKALEEIEKIDIDIEGNQPVQGLLMISWIANRLNWTVKNAKSINEGSIEVKFIGSDKRTINFRLVGLPIGQPSIHPGKVIGIRLICKSPKTSKEDICVILASKSGECMRLEAGGMANMELIEQVVPDQSNSTENDVARLLSSSRGTTSPLFSAAVPIASNIMSLTLKKINS